MNAIPSGAVAGERLATAADEPNTDKSSDAAWIVLEAANDLGDHATVEACRRVIDPNLDATLPSDCGLRGRGGAARRYYPAHQCQQSSGKCIGEIRARRSGY